MDEEKVTNKYLELPDDKALREASIGDIIIHRGFKKKVIYKDQMVTRLRYIKD